MSKKGILISIGTDVGSMMKDLGKASSGLQSWSSRMNAMGSSMTYGFTLPVGLALGAAVKFGGELDAMQKALAANMGSADAARKELELLRIAALAPGLGFEQAVKGSVRLQSMGIEAGVARDILLGLGKATELSAGGQEEFGRAMEQMVQIMAKGKLTYEDWRRVVDAVPAMNKVLKELYGTTNIDAIKSKAGFSVGQFIQDITKSLNGLQGTGGSVKNSLENVAQGFKILIGNAGLAIIEIFDLGKTFDYLSGKSAEWSQQIKEINPGQKTLVKEVGWLVLGIAALGPLIKTIANIGTAFSGVLIVAKALISVVGGITSALVIASTWAVSIFGAIINKVDGTTKALENAKGASLTYWESMWAGVKKFSMMSGGLIGLIGHLIPKDAMFPTLAKGYEKPKPSTRFAGIGTPSGRSKEEDDAAWAASRSLINGTKPEGDPKKESILSKFHKEMQALRTLANATGKDIGEDLKSAFESYTEEAGKAGEYTGQLKTELEALGVVVKSHEMGDREVPIIGSIDKLKIAQQVLADLAKTMGDIDFKAALPGGDSSSMNADKTSAVSDAIMEMKSAGMDSSNPFMQGLISQLDLLSAKAPKFTASMATISKSAYNVGDAIKTIWQDQKLEIIGNAVDGLAGSFTAMIEGSSNAAQSFIASVLSMAKAMVKLIMMQYIAKVMAPDSGVKNPVAAIAAAAIGGTVLLGILGSMGSKSNSVALAGGGAANKPTHALIGEYVGANNNPEGVMRLDQFQRMLDTQGGNVNVMVTGRLQGADIHLSAYRTDKKRARYGGFTFGS